MLSLPDLVRKHASQAVKRLPFSCHKLRWMDFVLRCNLLRRLVITQRFECYRGSKLIRKLRLFVISVTCCHCWVRLSALFSFAGPLHKAGGNLGLRSGKSLSQTELDAGGNVKAGCASLCFITPFQALCLYLSRFVLLLYQVSHIVEIYEMICSSPEII